MELDANQKTIFDLSFQHIEVAKLIVIVRSVIEIEATLVLRLDGEIVARKEIRSQR